MRKIFRVFLYGVATIVLTLMLGFVGAGILSNTLPDGKIDAFSAYTLLSLAFFISLFLNVRLYRFNNRDRRTSGGRTGPF